MLLNVLYNGDVQPRKVNHTAIKQSENKYFYQRFNAIEHHSSSMGKHLVIMLMLDLSLTITGVSLSEPHTNQYYEKIAVLMYVCMIVFVCLYVQ